MQHLISAIAAFLLMLLPALSTAAPVPRQVQVTPELYDMVHGLSTRAPPNSITVKECKEQRKSGFEFCVEGRNLCESLDEQKNRKWEWVSDSTMVCPPTGWTSNPSIKSIKVGRSEESADVDSDDLNLEDD